MNCSGDNRTASVFTSKLTPAADICVGLTILTVVLLSVLGNGLVLVICYHRRRKLVGSELLCVNLAAVDFLCCICFYPLSILSSFHHAWVGESTTCVYYGFGCFVFGLCSMFTITAISVLRYLKTCYSLVYAVWMKGANIWIVCCCIWLVATVWSSFPLFGWGEYVPEPYGLSCTVAWRGYHTSTKDAFYVICSFTCFTLIPVLLIVVSQCQIISRVSRFSYQLSARGIRNNLQYTEKRLSMMFFCISLGFVIAWAPYTVVSFLFIFHKGNRYMAPGGFVFPALFAKSSHIYNPFIYFYFNKTFQKEFRHLFFNLWHKRGENRVGIRFTVGQENAHPIDIQFQERDSPQKKTTVSQDKSHNRNRSKDKAEDGGIKPVYICWDFTLDNNTRLIMENKPSEDHASHLRHLAQRRRSAPSLAFGKALGIPWSPIREEASCWVTAEQSPFVLGLTSENGELLLDECVQVTEGSKTKDRHLFLFRDVIVFAKLKSNTSYRLKHRVNLQDIWLYGFEDNLSDVEEPGDVDLRVTLILAWALTFCWVFFCSPEVKERWSDTLHRIIDEAKARVGRCSSPPGVLMKMLSGSIPTKTLAGMEQFQFPLQGNGHSNNQGDTSPPTNETKWSLVRRLKKGHSFVSRTRHSDTDSKMQLFGQPLFKICPDELSLPKPVTEMLMLLRRKGPSTEGVFRKPCNSKIMREIREQLNSGLQVDMEAQPAVLLVGLLKSFLKELPGSLLVSDLYDDWVAALDNKDNQQRILEVKRVADKLPGPNKVLLQHLACVLHHILESADTNKMDAHNLAVCIAPTLLHLNGAPLDEQKEKIEKVTELTQFLLEHFELLGENIPNLLDTDEDSISSQHHDSAYDSTDPDGDAEGAESVSLTHRSGGSASSLNPPDFTAPPWQLDLTFDAKVPFNRRCSEPIILLSPDLKRLCGHARSHDDCSVERRSFEEQPLKKQISDDSFLLRRSGGAKLVLPFPKLSSCSYVDPLHRTGGSRMKDSCSSLESTASNQSEGSVFTSSPVGSPLCTRRTKGTNQPSGAAAAEQGAARLMSDQKRRSQSMRVATKVLLRTRSLGAFSRSSLKKDPQKENSFPCETLPEDSQSETDPPSEVLLKTRPLSAIEVFKLVDSRLPCRPPSYEHALQSTGLPPQYGSITVHDAMERRSRPSSVNYDCSPAFSVSLYTDCFTQMAQVNSSTVEQQQPFRQRAMSESVSDRTHEAVSRRCSQPVFEDFSYAKESYV